VTFWLVLALMTGATICAVIWPFAQVRKAVRSGSDIEVYRDQLGELERDLKAGSIGEPEAEAVRVEIARRLLAAADAVKAQSVEEKPATMARYRRAAIAAVLLLLPLGTVGLYLRLGSPELASESSAAERGSPSEQQTAIESTVAKVEAHLQKNPKDGRGWEVLAPVYLQLGRYSDSVRAWRSTLLLLGETADRQANLGEALVAEANGIVTDEANSAFVRAVTLDKTTVGARYYLGVAAEQDGKREEAAEIWRDLIAEAPESAHWVSDVRTALARVEGPQAKPSRGPTAEQVAAAMAQPPDQQTAMIRGMVDGLAARLKQDGSDIDGWVRLVRSYKVMGDSDKARAAISDAQLALQNDPEKIKQLDAALKELNVSSLAPAASPPAESPRAPAAQAQPQHGSENVQAMVDRLAERLSKSGSDPDSWIMLVRSYSSLGQKDKMDAAITNARAALAGDSARLRLFDEALRRLGVDGPGSSTISATAPAAATPVPAQVDEPNSEMIRGMVSRLADRLKQDGSDFDGWMRLVRSYVVLGERDKAVAAAADARRTIGNDADKRRRFDEFVKSLGLEG
jgi:cytochrome c-type biogenesis protein CcmH